LSSLRAPQRYEATWFDLFDTVTTLRGYAGSEAEFQAEADKIYDTLLRCHRLCDIYYDYAGLNNLKTVNDRAGGEAVAVDPELLDLMELCQEMYAASGGAVDVTMGPVLALWHVSRETETPPDPSALAEAAKHTGFERLELDGEAMTLRLTDPLARLDVGAVAKGWAAGQAIEAAPAGYLLSVGGNVCVSGPKPDGSAWTVALENPDGGDYLHTLNVTGGSVVTSGDYQRYFLGPDGTRYHHIIDPETLYPAARWRAVSVLCSDSGVADALSTALFVLDRDAGERLAERYGAEALWLGRNGDEYRTAGFFTIS
ncbi:MAG: FAD:protein FMN transferase, partial [Oscillospiraceae bacterium]|nr:FAD:protein FMN transferase [Oscillospiraceae bacterium]